MLIQESISLPRARVLLHQERAYDFDAKTGLWQYRPVGEDEVAFNILTNTGRVQLHHQAYATAALLTNGFNWIALSNDAGVPAAADATLAAEINGGGLGLDRVQGAVTLATGAGNVTTIANTFTYLGVPAQGIQKTALFTATNPGGVMNHEIAFTPRTLFTNDTITVTFTITLG